MKKSKFVELLASRINKSVSETEKIFRNVLNSMVEVVKSEGQLDLNGYLKIKTVDRAARKGRNPRTGAAVNIPARKTVKAVLGKAFKK
jgi:DNA-binding protein HU-beta